MKKMNFLENGFDPTAILKQKIRFHNNKGKSVVLAIIGEDMEFNMTGAHIDSPRLDLKPKPFYEDGNLALLKTHYYGGIKKYHWYDPGK